MSLVKKKVFNLTCKYFSEGRSVLVKIFFIMKYGINSVNAFKPKSKINLNFYKIIVQKNSVFLCFF